jgi:amino acid transporter
MATQQELFSASLRQAAPGAPGVSGMGASRSSVPDDSAEPRALASEEYVVKTMPRVADSLGLTATFVLIIFFITNVPSAIAAGAGTFTFWIVGAITFFIPCVIATAQLGHMFPHEGSLYNWTHRAFGGYWSFFVAFCAWFPCVLLMIVAADAVVAYIQGLNGNWLQQPYQQGLVLIVIVAFAGFLASRRLATILYLAKMTLVIAFLAVLMVGVAGLIWVLKGNALAFSMKSAADFGFAWNPSTGQLNYYTLGLFGFIVQAFLGIEVPLNLGGEMISRRVVTRHLLWGMILVLVGYFVASFGVLAVLGTAPSGNPFALAMAVKTAMGGTAGNIVALFVLINFVVTPAIYCFAYARLLLVGGIDKRLPVGIARLNKHRVPRNAIIFETVIAAVLAGVLYILLPAFTDPKNAINLNTIVYNVVISASTLVWAISTAFLFIDLVKLYFMDSRAFRRQLIFPMPVLWTSIVLGTLTCALSILGTLLYSLIPQLISNSQWWYIVGGITALCLIVAFVGGLFASSEAAWEDMSKV